MPAVLIAGQSNCEGLHNHLTEALIALDRLYGVINTAAGGTGLVYKASPGTAAHAHWEVDDHNDSPWVQCRTGITGTDLRAVWWIQGENEAIAGGISEDEYLAALIVLRGRIETVIGRGTIPFMVSPIGAPHELYKYSRPILAAQYRSVQHGFILGPEYYDLLDNGPHMSDGNRVIFAKRGAAILAPLL